jgi:hypothetical protein
MRNSQNVIIGASFLYGTLIFSWITPMTPFRIQFHADTGITVYMYILILIKYAIFSNEQSLNLLNR